MELFEYVKVIEVIQKTYCDPKIQIESIMQLVNDKDVIIIAPTLNGKHIIIIITLKVLEAFSNQNLV